MPYKSKISNQVLIQLVQEGLSDQEIADQFGVTRQNVSARRQRVMGKRERPADKINSLLRVRWEDADLRSEVSHSLRCLKLWLRLQYGDEIRQSDVDMARAWVAERNLDNQVLDYDEATKTWILHDRRPGDGRYLVDWPSDLDFPTKKFQQALELPSIK